MSGSSGAPKAGKVPLLDWLDSVAKLVGAFAVLGVAFIANSLQSRLTGISIQSQREQAESQLRASMFNSLIVPLAGSQTDGAAIRTDREELLAELLALNFHENFELKPLMEDAGRRLIEEARKLPQRPAGTPDVRASLWSIARRTAERQKASIAREWEAYRAGGGERAQQGGFFLGLWAAPAAPDPKTCETSTIAVDATTEPQMQPIQAVLAEPPCQVSAAFRDAIDVQSPDGKYTLRLWAGDADWENQTVKLSVLPFRSEQHSPGPTDTIFPFTLTWFDLPFTDNTLLPDGNRFAIYLRLHESRTKKVVVVVMWFPNGYFTPRERPLNYREVQELLGRKSP